jgi:hypothetical protein
MNNKNYVTKMRKQKRAVSLVLSYVLLIAISISVSVIVYMTLKKIATVSSEDPCPEETSLALSRYTCDNTLKVINLTIKNNGYFNISGFYIRGNSDASKDALDPLINQDPSVDPALASNGIGFFIPPLKPGAESRNGTQNFSYSALGSLKKVEIQPFVMYQGERSSCHTAIRVEISGCT